MVDEKQAYCFVSASEPKLTNTAEVQDSIQRFKVGKTLDPKGIQITVFKNLPPCVASLLLSLFKEIITSMDTRSPDFHPENSKGSGGAQVLSTLTSARHVWKAV